MRAYIGAIRRAWQAGNRQLNREMLEYDRMKAYYESKKETPPYTTLAGFRWARRAQAAEYKENRKVWGKSLTLAESDVIITNESIKHSFGQKTGDLKTAVDKADPLIANAFEHYQRHLKIIDSHYTTTTFQTAHFSPKDGGIRFDIDEDGRPDDETRKQFQTYFHETGHHLDYIIGLKVTGKGPVTKYYQSKKYQKDTLYYNKQGQVVGRVSKGYSFDEMIEEEGKSFIETYRQLVTKKTGKRASNKEVYEEICRDFEGEVLVNKRQLSDILDGISKGEMCRMGYSLGSSHTQQNPHYWEKHSVGSEAFAHFTSALSTNSVAMEKLINIFEKSYEIYKEIMSL